MKTFNSTAPLAMATVLALFAFSQFARASGLQDPTDCGVTVFGALCANVSFTAVARTPGFAVVNIASFPTALLEDAVLLRSPQVGSAFASDTRAGLAVGIDGSDDSIPNAFWIRQAVWTWNGGAFSFFNSIGTFAGRRTAFADALIVLDPPGSPTPLQILDGLVGVLGGDASTLPSPVTLSPDPTTSGGVNLTPAGGFGEVPEPATGILLLLGAAGIALGGRLRRRGGSLR
jgi:PEP-CTERM motif